METIKIIIVTAIWIGMTLSLITGFFYSPNFAASRSSDPKAYWAGMIAAGIAALIATFLLLR